MWWWSVLHSRIIEMKEKEKIEWYEYADKRICKYGLQRESCRQCLFETLCNLENNKKQDAMIQWS